jgi:hypothetical protein
LRKLDGKSCPGEAVCTSDRKNGQVAGVHGRSQGYTLKNHCHNAEVTPFNGLKEPCPFFDTKPENVPANLLGAIQTAEEFKELKMLGLLEPNLDKITAFEYTCYAAAEYAANTIEAEEIDRMNKESKKADQAGVEKFGANPTVPVTDSAFGSWEE